MASIKSMIAAVKPSVTISVASALMLMATKKTNCSLDFWLRIGLRRGKEEDKEGRREENVEGLVR